jgi:hypothetical protein
MLRGVNVVRDGLELQISCSHSCRISTTRESLLLSCGVAFVRSMNRTSLRLLSRLLFRRLLNGHDCFEAGTVESHRFRRA